MKRGVSSWHILLVPLCPPQKITTLAASREPKSRETSARNTKGFIRNIKEGWYVRVRVFIYTQDGRGERQTTTNLLQATVRCEKTAANSSKYSIPQRALISPHTLTSIQDGSGFSTCDWPGDMPEMRKRHSVGSILSSP